MSGLMAYVINFTKFPDFQLLLDRPCPLLRQYHLRGRPCRRPAFITNKSNVLLEYHPQFTHFRNHCHLRNCQMKN